MSFLKKVEAGAPLIKALQTRIENGEDAEFSILANIPCLGCDFVLKNAMLIPNEVHPKGSLWHYFVHCPECNYQTSLAKFVGGYECRMVKSA